MNDSDENLEDKKLELLKSTIEKRPFGYTLKEISDIQEIKDEIGSRNTVRKYIDILKDQGEIKSRKIGAYKLYHSKKRLIMKKLFREYPQLKTYLLNIFKSLTNIFSDEVDEVGKQVGIEMFKTSEIMKSDLMKYRRELQKDSKEIPIIRYLRLIKLFLSMNFDQTIKIEEKENGIYHFIIENKDIINEGADIHFYMQAGFMESFLSNRMDRKIKVNVVDPINKKEKKCLFRIELEGS
ncbi:MAG: hypothetical protein EU549_04610 [Promethearchaeota archaeon]|nr:MAG: hypothetical protein EU549_04610 [Candidatus Lokiarchaeota archaeon]